MRRRTRWPALILALTLGACSPRLDYGRCLQTEQYTFATVIMVGKVGVPQLYTGHRCVAWEFPEGRPAHD